MATPADGLRDALRPLSFRTMRTTRRWLRLIPGLLAALAAAGCGRNPRPDRVILVTLDTQRADHIGAYGAGAASTPRIDGLARDGILFRNAYSPIPITMPAHASIFFSAPPHELRNYNNGQKVGLRRTHPSLTNLFRKAGFSTGAFVSLGVLAAGYGLDQGFADYVDDFPPDRWYLTAGEVNARVFPWLEANKDRPFFLWVHYSDPHDPYSPPGAGRDLKLFLNGAPLLETSLQTYTLNTVDLQLRPGRNDLRFEFENAFDPNPDHFLGRLDLVEFSPPLAEEALSADFSRGWYVRRPDDVYFFKGRSEIALVNPGGPRTVRLTFRGKPLLSVEAVRTCYRREVEYLDGEVGKLWARLRELGLYERSAIILVGDHGEGLGEYHNDLGDPHVGHVHFLYGVYTKVPFIIKPAGPPGKAPVRDDLVSLLDVAPTAAGMMRFKVPPAFRGRDLLRRPNDGQGEVFEETYKPEAYRDRFGLLAPPWHLIFSPEDRAFELYDLVRDPGEKTDVYPAAGAAPEIAGLRRRLEEFSRDILSGKGDIRIDDQTKEMLRALGYIR